MCIGEKIAEMRKLNKMTQKDLAEKLNVSDKVISKWETGKSLPDVETMLPLSKVLGISISELYECVEKSGNEKAGDYNEEMIFQYKKNSIISSSLVILAPVLFLLTAVKWTGSYEMGDIFNFILTMLSIATFALGVVMQLVQFVRLYSYSKTKFNQTEYKKVLSKYGGIYLLCLLLTVAFPFVLAIIALAL